MLTAACLFLPLAGAAAAPALTRVMRHNAAWPLALCLLVPFLIFASHGPAVSDGAVLTGGFAWAPSFGLEFSWRLDGLSVSFALLISGIGTLIVLYAGGYLKGHPHQGRFFSFLLMFSTAMLGIVVADNLLMLFVFWELTSITSFLLIGFDHERPAARRAALQALLVTGGGGLFLLAGLLLLGQMADVGNLSSLLVKGATVRAHPLLDVALVLVLFGAFTKSAQFPFHFWLPNAMEAPTPVSAYLHSATMVKAGVYLLMRLTPVFGETGLWQVALPLFGGVTLLVGAVLALRQTDLKLMLAYTTVASLGLLVMLTGIGSERAIEAAVLYLVAHALFKGALFMIAGVIDHEAGTRDITRLAGLRKSMPLTAVAAMLAALSMGGVPLLAGFMAKEEIYAALLHGDGATLLALLAAIAGNAMMFATGFAIALKPFFGLPVATPKHAHDGPLLLMAGPVLLALAGVVAATFSSELHWALTSPMASAISAHPVDVTITAVPHLGLPFALSLLTILLGLGILAALATARSATDGILTAVGWGPDRGFDQAMAGLIGFSHRLGRLLQPGRLDIYMMVIFIVIAASLLWPMLRYGELPDVPAWPAMQFHEAGFMLVAIIGLVAVLIARSRLTAIVSLGIQGFAVAVLYLLFGAPDLAFTQFMVETLSVVILALIMTRLRLDLADQRPVGQILLAGLIAIACGTGFSLFMLRAVESPFNSELTAFFSQYSKVVAHGANVVNVIIVDFRGTDTLGEIAVVVITGLAILALIRLRPAPAGHTFNDPEADEGADG